MRMLVELPDSRVRQVVTDEVRYAKDAIWNELKDMKSKLFVMEQEMKVMQIKLKKRGVVKK